MTSTIQKALSDIETLHEKYENGADIPIRHLLRPWLALTDLEWQDALNCSSSELWDDLHKVHEGLSAYLKVMGGVPQDNELQEAACRLIGSFTLSGSSLVEGDIEIGTKMTITFEGGAWVYVTDPKLRLRATKPIFSKALAEVRKMLE